MIKFVNVLNLEVNLVLKPKKERKSKSKKYFLNIYIKLIIDMSIIISQGKPANVVYFGLNFIIN